MCDVFTMNHIVLLPVYDYGVCVGKPKGRFKLIEGVQPVYHIKAIF